MAEVKYAHFNSPLSAFRCTYGADVTGTVLALVSDYDAGVVRAFARAAWMRKREVCSADAYTRAHALYSVAGTTTARSYGGSTPCLIEAPAEKPPTLEAFVKPTYTLR